MNYYNEHDPFAAQWLRNLISAGEIPDGLVDERSIVDVKANDLVGYSQCHFFAGIAGWSLALRLAGMPDDYPLWSGSCPCQPFSAAGKGLGTADERHLWPEFKRLIEACRPPIVIGEQVASAEVVGTQLEASFVDAVQRGDYAAANKYANRLVKTGSLGESPRWVDGISTDLEKAGYTVWPCVLGAHSVAAPHIRQRLFWVADSGRSERERGPESAGQYWGALHTPDRCGADGLSYSSGTRCEESRPGSTSQKRSDRLPQRRNAFAKPSADRSDDRLEHGIEPGLERHAGHGDRSGQPRRLTQGQAGSASEAGAVIGGMVDDDGNGRQAWRRSEGQDRRHESQRAGESGFWSDFRIVACRDGTKRRLKSDIQCLVNGISRDMGQRIPRIRGMVRSASRNRTGRLRGYGNAIVPQVAAEFIKAAFTHETAGTTRR